MNPIEELQELLDADLVHDEVAEVVRRAVDAFTPKPGSVQAQVAGNVVRLRRIARSIRKDETLRQTKETTAGQIIDAANRIDELARLVDSGNERAGHLATRLHALANVLMRVQALQNLARLEVEVPDAEQKMDEALEEAGRIMRGET